MAFSRHILNRESLTHQCPPSDPMFRASVFRRPFFSSTSPESPSFLNCKKMETAVRVENTSPKSNGVLVAAFPLTPDTEHLTPRSLFSYISPESPSFLTSLARGGLSRPARLDLPRLVAQTRWQIRLKGKSMVPWQCKRTPPPSGIENQEWNSVLHPSSQRGDEDEQGEWAREQKEFGGTVPFVGQVHAPC